VQLVYFTDPLCCWSWGMQPHLETLERLLETNAKYVMGGMLPSWERFHDEINSVNRPAQMGPVWMHAAQLIGRPINYGVWVKNPPSSSYPACVAVKCVQQQSLSWGTNYFNLLQQAVMMDGKNISSWPVLEEVAIQLKSQQPTFDIRRFTKDYQQQNALPAFREDLELATRYNIKRFPTLLVKYGEYSPITISGYRPLDQLITALEQAFGVKYTIPA